MCMTAGILSETETLMFPLAQSFVEHGNSPLAAVDVVVTGARPQDPPPRISHGVLTVIVQMSALLSSVQVSMPTFCFFLVL